MNTKFESIKAGLIEAIEHAKGQLPKMKIHRPLSTDVRPVRGKTEIPQDQFVDQFGVELVQSKRQS